MTKGIQKMFSEVPQTYELVNSILTFGLDVLWRRRAARTAMMEKGSRYLDMGTGTGQTAMLLMQSSKQDTTVVAVDFSNPMIRKATEKEESSRILFAIADAGALPFPDGTFDAITISFATRNINPNREYLVRCLREFRRVLKSGGVLVNLETSQPPSRFVRKLFHLYVRLFVKPVGYSISGTKGGYAYLANTILRFYGPEELEDIIKEAGFSWVETDPMSFGVAAIHKAVK